jgi:hypothetical protein
MADKGCDESLVGFADVTELSQLYSLDTTYPRAIAFLAPLPRGILAQLADAQSDALRIYYDELSEILNETSQAVADYITNLGYAAYARPVDEGRRRDCHFRPEPMQFLHHEPGGYVSHLEVAMHAGLGWLGKCGHVVTKPFGSAVVIDSVLTNMPLECCKEVFLSRCGRCQECLYACNEMTDRQAALADAIASVVSARIGYNKNTEEDNQTLSLDAEGGEGIDSTEGSKSVTSAGGPSEPSFAGKVVFAVDQSGVESMCGACIYSCPYTKSYMFRGAVSPN